MNDPLKKYVQENRGDFDHLDPSADVLQRIKAQLKPAQAEKKGILKKPGINKWFIAASIYLGLVAAYMFWDNKQKINGKQMELTQQVPVEQPKKEEIQVDPKPAKTDTAPIPTDKSLLANSYPKRQKKVRSRQIEHRSSWPEIIHKQITDSNSASLRLAAVLEIDKKPKLNNDLLLILSKTMNQDANSNVRLAAMDVLGKNIQDPKVTEMLIQALAKQDDPIVQLGLINVLGEVNNKEMDQTLLSLTNNPNTFAAVKDEAYSVLLQQNKL